MVPDPKAVTPSVPEKVAFPSVTVSVPEKLVNLYVSSNDEVMKDFSNEDIKLSGDFLPA